VSDTRLAPHPWFGTGAPPTDHRLPAEAVAETVLDGMRDVPYPRRPVALQPFVLPRASYEELFRAARVLLRLLRRALVEAGPTRRARIDALGASDDEYPLFVDDEDVELSYCDAMARLDTVVGPDGPRFLEANVSGAVGNAVQTHLATRAWTDAYGGPGVAPFTGHDPFAARVAMYDDVCAERDLERAVALVGSVRDLFGGVPSTRYFDVELDHLRRNGYRAEFFEPEDLVDGLGLPGEPRFPLGLRHFTVPEWRDLGISWEPVQRALEAGCLLLSPQTCYLVANKKVMAWVSEEPAWMNDAERAFVRRYVPWTRVVTDGPAAWEGRSWDLPDLLVRRRERFVLKGAIGMKGLQVHLGCATPEAEWQDLVGRAVVDGDTVAQEFVEQGRCPVEWVEEPGDEARWAEVAPVLSPFVFGDRAAGCLARYFVTGEADRVVSLEGYGALMNVALAER
jgi:hypothetical protein